MSESEDVFLSDNEPANPYAPPSAVVADIPPPLAVSARPPSVLWAVRLLWVAVALGALFIAVRRLPPMSSGVSPLAVRAFGLLVLALWGWLVLKIAAGRNWARLTWIVITALGTLSTLISPQKLARLGPIEQASFTLQTTLQLAACVLLVSPRARRWFKSRVSHT